MAEEFVDRGRLRARTAAVRIALSMLREAWSEQWKWRWWKLFWYRGMDGYSESDRYGNSKIWRQMISGQKK